MEINKDTKFLLGLHAFPKFGSSRIKKIKNHFLNYKKGFSANAEELIKAGIEEKIVYEFINKRKEININKIIETIEKEKIKILSLSDSEYPPLLKEIYNPPFLLYYRGKLEKNHNYNLSIVGSRKFTSYGKEAVLKIAYDLAQKQIILISGLALGIDTLVHQSAIKGKTKTYAVLGSGVNDKNIYPRANYYLAQKIISENGSLISEFPLFSPPLKHHFPQRNRIISGLSLGTLVIEANQKSGALITARFALEQNREVFALPGNIFNPSSLGPLKLIKDGATPIKDAEDILEALDLNEIKHYIDNKKIIADTPEEEKIIKLLSKNTLHINEIARLSNLNISLINSTLALMEIKGLVKNIGGMEYALMS